MIISYFGKQFFKIQQGEMVVAFNPVSKNSKTGISAKFGSDIAFITINTIYALSVDSINIVFLGALSDTEIPKEAWEAIDGPDILFVPVGGNGVLDAKQAAKFASSLEPKMIIPMDYDSSSLKLFLKEIGEEKAEVVDKLTLKRKDLENKESEVVVLKAI